MVSCCGKGPYQESIRDTRPVSVPRKTKAVCVAGFRKHQFSDQRQGIVAADKCLRCGAPNRGR
jgi:hypothetical protein